MAITARLAVVAALFALAAGHSSLLVPPTRNAVDRSLAPWRGGSRGDGKFGPDGWGCNCVNGTTDGQTPCDVGQSCFWFSNGCSIGCKTCDGGNASGTNPNVRDRCNSGAKATINAPELRTYNRNAPAGSAADIYKHNPWRAPGTAPTFDPCGMAGGNWRKVGGEAKYSATTFAKQGDLGSKVLPKAPSGTVWHAGQEETTVISIRANHGGGYAFRLCPAEAELTEACFEATPVPFVRNQQRLRWANGTELNISGTYITEGTHPKGSMWAMNPLPYSNAGSPPQFPPPCHEKQGRPLRPHKAQQCALADASSPAHGFYECHPNFCSTGQNYAFAGNVTLDECVAQCHAHNCTCFDYNDQVSGVYPFTYCHVASQPQDVVPSARNYTAYAVDRPGGTSTSPTHGGMVTDGFCSGQFPYNVMIVDTLAVPATIKPGEYVLGFRWDCEKSAQVWSACADITIV